MKLMPLMCLGLLSLSMSILSGCSREQAPATEKIPLVMVAQPAAHLQQVSSYAGEIQAKQHTALAFRVGGQITKRYVDVGDRVSANQVLAELDVQDAQLQLNAAQAQLDNAHAAAKLAHAELKRFQQLLPINAVSQSQFDAVNNQHKAAQAQLQQAQANLAVAKNQTRYNRLTATQAGIITQRTIEVGQVVAAGQSAYELAINGEREVVIGVAEQAVANIRVGQPATVVLWSQPDQRLNAVVREISPAADQSRTFSVKVAIKDGNKAVQLGQSARVHFQHAQQQLSVPLSSVSAQDKQAYVFTLQANNTLKKVPVVIGEYGREEVSILSDLDPHAWVVIGGVHLLRDQQKISPIDRDNHPVRLSKGA